MESETTFTFDNIQNWTGEGENEAAFVVQWNVEGETNARVYGYRWDGDAYGIDMVRAICSNNPDLYCLVQYTGSMGYTINGIGFDADDDGEIGLIDSSDGTTYSSEDGVFIHPRGAESGGSPVYDYDNWEAADADDFWAAGWYTDGYWSYWVSSTSPSDFSYSGLGASSRKLTNGCWDGWNFMQGFSSSSWKEFVAAPSQTPEGATTRFKVNGIYYTLKSYNKKTVEVSAPFELEGETLSSYSGEITIPTSFSYYDNVSQADVTYTVVGISNNAFENSEVTTISLPESVVSIGEAAFKNSSLASINITDKITKLKSYAFYGCKSLTEFALPSSLTVVPEGLLAGTGISSLTLTGVEEIGASAFENCASLASVTFDSSLTSIGASAFSGCGALKEIKLDENVSTIGEKAFADCNALTSVTVNHTIPLTITEDVFSTDAYANATLSVPVGYKSSYTSATGWSNFTNITEHLIDVNVGDYFEMGGVAYIVTANDETLKTLSVSNYLASGTSNSLISAANKAGYVGDVVIPSTVTYQNIEFSVSDMLEKAFYGAAEMTSVKFENSFTKLPSYSLYNCSGLTSVTFPSGMTEMGDWSMFGCKALTSIAIPETVTVIGSRVFYDCSGLTAITLPENLESLGGYTFNGCKGLTSIVIPNKIKELGDYLFSSCSNLTSIGFASDITKIGQRTFSDCTSLSALTIPETVTSIGQYAFAYTAITEMILPDAITSLPGYLFLNCTSLKSVTMNNVTSIGAQAFAGCTALETFVSPENLTTINNYAFKGCTSLKDVTIGDNVTKLGNYVFQKCTALKVLEIPASVTSLGSNLVSGCSIDIAIYICNPEPISWSSSYKFNTENSSTIAPINVVYGSKAAYEAANGWKNSVVNEVMPEISIDMENKMVEASSSSARLAVPVVFAYADESVPALFRSCNNVSIKADSKFQFEYREAPAAEEVLEAKYYAAGEFIQLESEELDSDMYQVNITEGLTPSTLYEYRWTMTVGSNDPIYSETDYFETGIATGIDDIAADVNDADTEAEYFNLQGLKVDASNLGNGIYIKRTGEKIEKILIRK